MNTAYPLEKKGVKTSGYGERNGKMHRGVDIGVPVGTEVISIEDGTVVRSDMTDKKGYGNFICIEHPDLDGERLFSCYAHLSDRKKQTGDKVQKGEVIGLSGGAKGGIGSGTSTGPHLHFEIRKNLRGDWKNSENYLGQVGLKSNKDRKDKTKEEDGGLFSNFKNFTNIISKYAKKYDTASEKEKAMYEEVDRMKDIIKKIL